jgi:hypothetical protein
MLFTEKNNRAYYGKIRESECYTAHFGFFQWIAFPFYFGNTNYGKTIWVNDSTLRLALAYFGNTSHGKTQRILEILATEKRSVFWKY